jgi:hypothetical protein
LPSAAVPFRRLAAGGVDKDATHGLGRGGEEVAATIELLIADQPHVGFVNKSRGIERLTGHFGRHPHSRELPQLVIDERQEVLGCAAVAGLSRFEKACDVGHSRILTG